ncbi:methylmalonyl-CoA epimerase [Vulcanibacillus modesticaldus]|uniref:Methylmalonyl-CoA epimerase n=1 Tax=Vulcanibacillus modesticaldus TaxID=337097 RepID=A0A1D2YRX5_9BACI|nr:methylmalonyl-CoA epimerase [Vulcanibacillus modesticaldus]OEF95544.1 methylmalonyl-CoA epimerase [Vulcanibacillus modesticaldus]
MKKKIRVLIAKPGLDGHDRGALIIAQGLRDEGMEVIYTGLRQTPDQIVSTAIQEDVDCIGLSILSGAHNELFPEVTRLLKENGAEDILVIGGGVIPEDDIPYLKEQGVKAVFTPGTPIAEIVKFIKENVVNETMDSFEKKINKSLKKIDHIGIAVEKLDTAINFFKNTLGLEMLGLDEVANEGVKIAFFKIGDIKIELLEPIDEESPIYKYLQKKGEGIHHLAFEVEDILYQFQLMGELGIPLLQDTPKIGANGKKVGFIHPKASHKVLIEFCERGDG